MFKKLKEVLQRENLLKQSFDTLEVMLNKNRETFKLVTDFLITGKEIHKNIHKEDRKINRYEMEIRKKILEHVSIDPEQDVTFALILLGATRDVERTGDFMKNIYDISLKLENDFPDNKYAEIIKKQVDIILKMFDLTCEAFVNSDEEKAKQVVDMHKKDICGRSDQIVASTIDDSEIKVKNAVVYALLAVYFRRISAHLANVSSSVINPFEKVRYIDNDKELSDI
ncbi:MAG: hypothetical protein KAI71_02445 [Candidatus Pacebacteria bacterium]|nr:hypothetical protein [Candidatus Paceibacterota bacterium]